MIYTEAEYFDKFYPKSWGDWRKEYNLKMYCKHPRESGCTWMDYYQEGYTLTEDSRENDRFAKLIVPRLLSDSF